MPSYEDLRWDAESSCAACHGFGCPHCDPVDEVVVVADCDCRDCRSEPQW